MSTIANQASPYWMNLVFYYGGKIPIETRFQRTIMDLNIKSDVNLFETYRACLFVVVMQEDSDSLQFVVGFDTEAQSSS